MKPRYKISVFVLSLLIIVSSLSVAARGFAKMAAPTMISVEEVVTHLTETRKARELTAEENEFLLLAELGRDFAKVSQVQTYGLSGVSVEPGTGKIAAAAALKAMTPLRFASALANQIIIQGEWTSNAQQPAIEALKKNKRYFKKTMGDQPVAWAWFLFRIGEREEARLALAKSFDSTHEAVMKLSEKFSFNDNSTILRQEWVLRGLELLTSGSELEVRKEKLRTMKIYYSNLEDSGIVT